MKRNKAYCLNESSAAVWNECDGKNTIEQITRNIGNKFRVKISRDFVMLALEDLYGECLLEEGFEFSFDSEINRREMIKKAGLTAAISLPIITAIVSPLAAHAQSCATEACVVAMDCINFPGPGYGAACTNSCCVYITTISAP